MKFARISIAASESGVDKSTAQAVFSELVSEGTLQAKIRVRCPHCSAHQGIYDRKSAVPSGQSKCEICDDTFEPQRRKNWEVVYEIVEEDSDFFPNGVTTIQKFLDSEKNLPADFFERELESFREMENPQKRGRDFDYFMGLLFQQLPEVEVRIKPVGESGEVDVFMSCLDAPDWIVRLVGSCTVIENKWEKPPIQKGEVIDFHAKARELPNCDIAYFASMSGFTDGSPRNPGAVSKLRGFESPSIIDLWEDDIDLIVSEGSPESLMKDRQMM